MREIEITFKKDFEFSNGCFIKKGTYGLHRNYNPKCIFGTNRKIMNIRFWGLWINAEGFICITLEKHRGHDEWHRFYYENSEDIEVLKEK